MRRLVAVTVAVCMAWMSLGACYTGPAPVQYAALAVIDGRPTAVVAACGRPTVGVDLYLDDGTADQDPDLHLWSVLITLPSPVREVEVELLGAPRPGWKITSDKIRVMDSGPGGWKVVPLTSIEPGHHYTLDSSAHGPEGAMAPTVKFTTDDLPNIGAGQVLETVDFDHRKLVSRESFIHDRCG
ncbi:MAG TPA: hypothetical protein VFW21_15335 [Mycobacterium sp.]|nr:hypothetical protein [Mycobacterium sp.]